MYFMKIKLSKRLMQGQDFSEKHRTVTPLELFLI